MNPRNEEALLQQDEGEPWGCVNHPASYGYGAGNLCWRCHEAQPAPVTRPYLRWLDPATPKWEKDSLTGAPERDAMYVYRERTMDGFTGQVQWLHPTERGNRK